MICSDDPVVAVYIQLRQRADIDLKLILLWNLTCKLLIEGMYPLYDQKLIALYRGHSLAKDLCSL